MNNITIFAMFLENLKIVIGLTFEYRFVEERTIAMFFLKKNKNESEYDKKLIKCKECEMKFGDKDRLTIHSKKAHSGRGERKKKV